MSTPVPVSRARRFLRPWPSSLRRRQALAFALVGLAAAVLFAGTAYELTRAFLLDQRERTVLRQSYIDAAVLRGQLRTAGTTTASALAGVDTQGDLAVLVHRDGAWYSSSLDIDSSAVPHDLQQLVAGGSAGVQPARVLRTPSLVVGIPLPGVDAEFYAVRSQAELQTTLRTLLAVLSAGAGVATLLSAGLGAWGSRAVLRPLDPLAATAAGIASGQLSHRLPDTSDPDLATIIASFNSMADAVQQRIERDARFAADVSHELRSPLTTLVGCVDLLVARRAELSPAGQTALDLVVDEITRLRRLLEDLIGMARADPAAVAASARTFDLADLVRRALADARLPATLLVCDSTPHLVRADPRALAQVVANLLDNAERHAQGVLAVRVGGDETGALLVVEDAGPGVPADSRDRIFERFATLGSARGSTSGAGLGLALVRETVEAHGGAVWCAPRSGGGARFAVRLPPAPVPDPVPSSAEPLPAAASARAAGEG